MVFALSFATMSKPIICIGSSVVDELFHAKEKIILASTSDAAATKTPGGVARNIANQIALLGVPVYLISVFGNDSDSTWLKSDCESSGVNTDASLFIDGPTGKYTGILQVDGSLFAAFLTNPQHHLLTPAYMAEKAELLKTASYIVGDANLNADTISWLVDFSKAMSIPFIIEPVSVPPASKLANIDLNGLYMITPNEDELPVLCKAPQNDFKKTIDYLIATGIKKVWLHNGKHGSTMVSAEGVISLHAPLVEVVDCTGAGDGSLSGFLVGKYLGKSDMDCLKIAHTLAAEILQVNGAIAHDITQEQLLALVPTYYPTA